MISLKLLRSLTVLCALAMVSCANYAKVFAPASPEPGTRVNWPGVAFKEVRGYCYDYTEDETSSFFIRGRMSKGVLDPKGVKLSPEQVKRLLAAVTISQPKQSRSVCYRPHHAYVFYDAAGRPVAVFEMCFGCNRFVTTPGGAPEYIDYKALWQLTHDLDLPLGEGNEFYTDVCRAARKKRL